MSSEPKHHGRKKTKHHGSDEPPETSKTLKNIENDIKDIRHDLKDRLNTVNGYLQLSQLSSGEDKETYIKLSLEQLSKVTSYIDDNIK